MNTLFLLFVPKLRFHYAKKKAKKKTNGCIGGLDLETSPVIPGAEMSMGVQGDMILTTASPRILAAQVTELRRLLQEKERQEIECKCMGENNKTMTSNS